MATELAKAYVQIIPSAQGISGKIQQAIEPDAEVAGTSFGGKLVGKIKGVIATAAIGKALASTISEGAALEQSLGGIETLFKDSATFSELIIIFLFSWQAYCPVRSQYMLR